MDNNKTGQFIAACRKKKNMTQQQLADILGITNKAVSKWERGQGMPDIGILIQLSEVLDVSIDSIIRGRSDDEEKTIEYHNSIIRGRGDDEEKTIEYHNGNHENGFFQAEIEVNSGLFKKQCKYVERYINKVNNIVMYVSCFLILLLFAAYIAYKAVRYAGNSTGFYILFFILAVVLIFTYQKYLLKAHMLYKKFTTVNGFDSSIVYSFSEREFKVITEKSEKTYLYDDVTHIIHLKNSIILQCYNENFTIEDIAVKNNSMTRLQAFLQQKCTKAKHIHFSKKQRYIKAVSLISAIAGLLLAAMQAGYMLFGSKYQLKYIYDELYYVVNGGIILLIFTSAILTFYNKRKVLVSLICTAVFLLSVNIYYSFTAITTKTIISTSDSNMLILKDDSETGKTDVYRQELLLFARKKESLPYAVNIEDIKFQWLTSDSCAVTYPSPDESIHQYVATYGDREINGISYYNVVSVLSSSGWVSDNRKMDWAFSKSSDGFTMTHDGQSENFSYEECVQFGTIAVVLYKDNIPKWTISLNKDCKVDGGDLVDRGSITICQVSLDKTPSVIFTSTEPFY